MKRKLSLAAGSPALPGLYFGTPTDYSGGGRLVTECVSDALNRLYARLYHVRLDVKCDARVGIGRL
jgi:hypothetical protein